MPELPLTKKKTIKAVKWLKDNFGLKIENAVKESPFTVDMVCGIACQETAYRWVGWIDKYSIETILACCILDATGDVPGTEGKRRAFPVNNADFISKYGVGISDMLISEGNKMRALMGWGAKKFLYKGYGIFQNDLQNIVTNETFFTERKWYSFDECLNGLMIELAKKYSIQKNIPESIRAYNGRGVAANNYRDNVLQFTEWANEV